MSLIVGFFQLIGIIIMFIVKLALAFFWLILLGICILGLIAFLLRGGK